MRTSKRFNLVCAALLVVAAPASIQAQGLVQADAELQRLQADFGIAVGAFGSLVSQADSIPMFSRLITTLQMRIGSTENPAYRELLADSLIYRARAQFNNGDEGSAGDDVGELLRVNPGFLLERSELSPRFVELFDTIYDQTIGYLDLGVSPEDAQLRIDGELLESGLFSYPLVAGTHAMTLERAGYLPVQGDVTITAGESTFVEQTLERVSAVLRIVTRPTGARVTVNGQDRGVTSGEAPLEFVPTGDAALYPRREFSDALIIDGLEPGRHLIEVSLDGYRLHRSEEMIPDRADYWAQIPLERSAGSVVFENLPPNAEVSVDGVVVRPEFPADGSPRVTLEPGDHRVEVSRGTGGVFSANVNVVDQRTEVLQVRLLPGLSFLGVLGGDQRGARELAQLLTGALSAAEDWAVLDRTFAAPAFEGLGLTTDVLRPAAQTGTGGPDWAAVQEAFDREAPGSIYLLAVLDDDLVADNADLWIWPSAPGPAQPDVVPVRLNTAADVEALASGFEASTFLQGPWLGALTVDVGDAVLVTSVSVGGPAESAGLQVGDRIVSIADEMIAAARDVTRVVETSGSGAALAFQVQRGGATQIVELTVGMTPKVISPSDPDVVYSVISASLAAEAESGTGETPDWVLRLNQAAVLMHAGAWDDAVRTLREILDAPSGAGLGQATVDYWLGIALTALGPSYRDNAVTAFRDAASDPDARLFHNDGPWVAPRARARLAELGGGR